MSVVGDPQTARLMRRQPTPEGVELPVEVAGLGLRFAALLIDGAVMLLALLAIGLLMGLMLVVSFSSAGFQAILLIVLAFMRLAYFVTFELLMDGRTPGKRALKLKVVDRRGGPLRRDQVILRNILREVEFFQPLMMLAAEYQRVQTDPTVESHGLVAFALWVGVLILMPLFNRERLRFGDLIAGTRVIHVTQPSLDHDVALRAVDTATLTGVQGQYRFAPEHLDAYGIHELQVLEQVLRGAETQDPALITPHLHDIANRIARRSSFGRNIAPGEARNFLDAYYTALRSRLEERKRFGDEREDKHFRTRRQQRDTGSKSSTP